MNPLLVTGATCSHALYELKVESRQKALLEMKRVVRPDRWEKRTEPDGPVLFHDVIL
jgi:hypothetical protein